MKKACWHEPILSTGLCQSVLVCLERQRKFQYMKCLLVSVIYRGFVVWLTLAIDLSAIRQTGITVEQWLILGCDIKIYDYDMGQWLAKKSVQHAVISSFWISFSTLSEGAAAVGEVLAYCHWIFRRSEWLGTAVSVWHWGLIYCKSWLGRHHSVEDRTMDVSAQYSLVLLVELKYL